MVQGWIEKGMGENRNLRKEFTEQISLINGSIKPEDVPKKDYLILACFFGSELYEPLLSIEEVVEKLNNSTDVVLNVSKDEVRDVIKKHIGIDYSIDNTVEQITLLKNTIKPGDVTPRQYAILANYFGSPTHEPLLSTKEVAEKLKTHRVSETEVDVVVGKALNNSFDEEYI